MHELCIQSPNRKKVQILKCLFLRVSSLFLSKDASTSSFSELFLTINVYQTISSTFKPHIRNNSFTQANPQIGYLNMGCIFLQGGPYHAVPVTTNWCIWEMQSRSLCVTECSRRQLLYKSPFSFSNLKFLTTT
jgi:hypothetical protein